MISWSESKISGIVEAKNFTCKNNLTWSYEVSVFTLTSDPDHMIFAATNKISIQGSRSLKIKTLRNLSIDTVLDVSAVAMGNITRTRYLGGFVPNNTKCCYIGMYIIIRTTYEIFFCSNKPWTNPEFLSF